MPPRAIRSSVVDDLGDARSWRPRRAQQELERARPAGTSARRRSRRCRRSNCVAQRRARPRRAIAGESALAPRARASRSRRAARRVRGAAARISSRSRRPRLGDRLQHLAEARHPLARLGREVGAAVERHALGVEEHVQRPAAVAGHRLHRLHVDRVDVGALLAVDLDADEVLVHELRRLGVLERLVLHHVAPVAGRVADREQDRLVLGAGARERLLAPRVPVDGVVLVLEQVGAGLVGEAVGHVARLPGLTVARRTPRTRRGSAARCSSVWAIDSVHSSSTPGVMKMPWFMW